MIPSQLGNQKKVN